MLLRAPESLTSAFGGKANQAGATPLSTHTKGRTKWPIQNRAFLDACPSRHRDGRRRQTVHGRPPRACGLAIERTRSLVGPLADITRVAGNGRFRGQSGQPENARIADIGMSAACQITHDMEMI